MALIDADVIHESAPIVDALTGLDVLCGSVVTLDDTYTKIPALVAGGLIGNIRPHIEAKPVKPGKAGE